MSPTLRAGESGTNMVPGVLTPWDVQSKCVNTPNGTSPTLPSGTGEGMNIQPIVMTTEQPIVCAADDNGKAAVEEDMCGALKVGGGAP